MLIVNSVDYEIDPKSSVLSMEICCKKGRIRDNQEYNNTEIV